MKRIFKMHKHFIARFIKIGKSEKGFLNIDINIFCNGNIAFP